MRRAAAPDPAHGPEVPTQPAVLRLHDTLAGMSEALGREFLRILAAAPDLDPAAVSRRLLERHLGAGQAVDEARLTAALLDSTGLRLLVRGEEGCCWCGAWRRGAHFRCPCCCDAAACCYRDPAAAAPGHGRHPPCPAGPHDAGGAGGL
jgi:hypothetical protein